MSTGELEARLRVGPSPGFESTPAGRAPTALMMLRVCMYGSELGWQDACSGAGRVLARRR